jgi:hypothetical protein
VEAQELWLVRAELLLQVVLPEEEPALAQPQVAQPLQEQGPAWVRAQPPELLL